MLFGVFNVLRTFSLISSLWLWQVASNCLSRAAIELTRSESALAGGFLFAPMNLLDSRKLGLMCGTVSNRRGSVITQDLADLVILFVEAFAVSPYFLSDNMEVSLSITDVILLHQVLYDVLRQIVIQKVLNVIFTHGQLPGVVQDRVQILIASLSAQEIRGLGLWILHGGSGFGILVLVAWIWIVCPCLFDIKIRAVVFQKHKNSKINKIFVICGSTGSLIFK